MVNMKTFIKENWFRIGLLFCLLMIAYAVYQSFVVIPREKAEKQEIATILETQRIEKEDREKQENLDTCLADAERIYSINWFSSCKTLSKASSMCINIMDTESGYKNYLKSQATTTSISNLIAYMKAKDNCSCSLPTATAERWDSSLKDEKNACYMRYK